MPQTATQSKSKISLRIEYVKNVVLEKPSEGLELVGFLGQFALDKQGDQRKVTAALRLQAQLVNQLTVATNPNEPFTFAVDYGPEPSLTHMEFTSDVLLGAIRDAAVRRPDLEVETQSSR